jgi:hypothetical protein
MNEMPLSSYELTLNEIMLLILTILNKEAFKLSQSHHSGGTCLAFLETILFLFVHPKEPRHVGVTSIFSNGTLPM